MKISFVDLKREYHSLKSKIDSAVKTVISKQDFILGDSVAIFEKNISKYLGCQAVGCASGSDALLLSLMALGIKDGDEVITTPFSFIATATAISRTGAKPVFVDINDRTFNIDPKLIQKFITAKTKAIIVVHLFGNPADMKSILAIAKKHKLVVIEDACQAIGALYYGRKVGTLGDFGCFSFFPTKNLGGYGDGGLIACRKKSHYNLLKKLRVQGAKAKYQHDIIGINSRLDAIQAAILNVKIPYIDKWNNKRIFIAKKYNSSLKNIITTPLIEQNSKHVFHQYAILVKNRKKFINYLHSKGINISICYPMPFHLQKCFKYLGYKKGDFIIAEKISNMIVSLPIFPFMSKKELNYIVKAIKDFINKKNKQL